MEALIARVRRLIADAAASPRFTDDQIEAELDAGRRDVDHVALFPVISRDAAGTELRLVWASDRSPWEDEATLTGPAGIVVAADAEDAFNGRWTFNVHTYGPLRVTGTYYDLYGAAADLLEEWAASEAGQFDFATRQQSFKRSQATTGRRAMAQVYRRKALPSVGDMVREDVLC